MRRMLSRTSRTGAVLVAGALAGTVLLGPASAHFPGELKEVKQHVFTKKQANNEFVNVGEKAASATTADTATNATNADMLDGQDSAALAPRVASTFDPSPSGSVLATTSITVPASGYLILDGIANLTAGSSPNDLGSCLLRLNGTGIPDSEFVWTLDDVEGEDETCVAHTVVPITPGTHTVDLFVSGLAGTSAAFDSRVTALYVPFGPTGTRP